MSGLFEPIEFAERWRRDDVVRLIARSVPFIRRAWRQDDERTGHCGEAAPGDTPWLNRETIVRSQGKVVLVLGTLLQSEAYDESAAGMSRAEMGEKLNQVLRWAARTHLTGDLDVPEFGRRRRWGRNWQSELWSAFLAHGMFIARPQIDEDVWQAMLRVIAWEADRLVDLDPPSGRWHDTKAEETAWDALNLAWACVLMPDRSAAWREALRRWTLNIATTPDDLAGGGRIDGRPAREVISAVTLHPDGTLENHGSFHPSYLSALFGLTSRGMQAFLLAGEPLPDFYRWERFRQGYALYRRLGHRDGSNIPLAGQDWPHFRPTPSTFIFGYFCGDPEADRLTANHLRLVELESRLAGDGRFLSRHPEAHNGRFFQFTLAFAGQLAILASLPEDRESLAVLPRPAEADRPFVQVFPYTEMVVARGRRSVRAFAWRSLKRTPMGTYALLDDSLLTGTSYDSLIGQVRSGGAALSPRVVWHEEQAGDGGFITEGVVEYRDESAKVLVTERVRAESSGGEDEPLTITLEAHAAADAQLDESWRAPLYIFNDNLTGNQRRIRTGAGKRVVSGPGGEARQIDLDGDSVRIDGAVTYHVREKSDGLAFRYDAPAERRHGWKDTCYDRVGLSFPGGKVAQGQPLWRIIVEIGCS